MTRATWSQKYPESEPRAQGRDMSTLILGIGVFIVGVFILAIALIIGLEFPKFVKNRALDEQCVTNTEHEFYQRWRLEEDWVRYNKLYYWIIENPNEFLYHGHVPVLRERGPYVYREHIQRLNVIYQGTRVSFKNRIIQTFDASETSKQCGQTCNEDEQIAVLNTNFLISSSQVHGLENYILSKLPEIMKRDIESLMNQNVDLYNIFACLNASCEKLFSYSLPVELTLRNISFGSWIQLNDTYYKSEIIADKQEASFSSPEMQVVYNNVIASEQLGVNERHFINKTLSDICKTYVTEFICNNTINNSTVRNSNVNTKQTFVSSTAFLFSCGVLPILRAVDVSSHRQCLSGAASIFLNHICKNISGKCFNDVSQTSIYLSIRYYILEHLMNYVFNNDTMGVFSIIQTRSPRELALGSSGLCGFLKHHVTNSSSNCGETSYIMSTCLEERDTNNNMLVKEFRDHVMEEVCGSKDISECKSQSGHTSNLFPVRVPKACITSAPPSKEYLVWVERLYRNVEYSGPVETQFLETTVFLFRLNTSAYTSRTPEVMCMLWDISSFSRFPLWISAPHFQGCSSSPHASFRIPSGAEYSSFLEVEPVTGKVWRTVNRFQMNTVLQQDLVNVPGALSYNVSFINIALPVYWIEIDSHVTEGFRDQHHDKVKRLTDASCGGLIGLSVLSVIVTVISALVIIRPHSHRRVAPMPIDVPDESQNNTNLRI